ncbi:unnamed protein product [Phytomonas sp. Hart1]|nr:unnamed protein product [Phytomonas sp. Hart1]|eukprot:CCW66442.1 unnamed protein product [Phytomonas sp. isolate Hart1]
MNKANHSTLAWLTHVSENPYRSQVFSWYRKCLKAAFTVSWEKDEDALYVLEETRRLFYQNRQILEIERIERKLREVEMRYGLAIHYTIPYPRPFNKTQGSMADSGASYAAYLDSSYDHAVNPMVGYIQEGSRNYGVMGGGVSHLDDYFEDGIGSVDKVGSVGR